MSGIWKTVEDQNRRGLNTENVEDVKHVDDFKIAEDHNGKEISRISKHKCRGRNKKTMLRSWGMLRTWRRTLRQFERKCRRAKHEHTECFHKKMSRIQNTNADGVKKKMARVWNIKSPKGSAQRQVDGLNKNVEASKKESGEFYKPTSHIWKGRCRGLESKCRGFPTKPAKEKVEDVKIHRGCKTCPGLGKEKRRGFGNIEGFKKDTDEDAAKINSRGLERTCHRFKISCLGPKEEHVQELKTLSRIWKQMSKAEKNMSIFNKDDVQYLCRKWQG